MFSNHCQLASLLKDSVAKAQLLGFRALLVLPGDNVKPSETTLSAIRECFANAPHLHSSQSVTQDTVTIMHVPDVHSNSDVSDQINLLLGSEYKCVYFDANGVFNERLFAAAAGTVEGGGLLVLQTPNLERWPLNEKNTSHCSAFIARFVSKLKTHAVFSTPVESADAALIICATDSNQSSEPLGQQPSVQSWRCEQQVLIEQLLSQLSSDLPVVSVVQGDRGRGKSALIGRAVKQIIANGIVQQSQVSVTAHRRSACDVLMKHAEHSLHFLALDQALETTHDVLIVEEAGGIPIAMLKKLLSRCKKIVFATTVQGYEGSGRGFALRFASMLDKASPGWLKLVPTQPIRWREGDPVEAFVNDALLLETKLSALGIEKVSVEGASVEEAHALLPENASVQLIEQSQLTHNDELLSEIFGLLLQAHYQTTPTDLRNMLDKPELVVFAQHTNKVLTGAALVALEGDIDKELHTAIVQKRRRLPDQILPQLLAQSVSNTSPLFNRFARIVRIAVHPAIQNKGFGTALFHNIEQLLHKRAPTVGASFGADQQTLSFWLKLGLTPIHYGYKSNPRSGLRAACMMRSDEPTVQNNIVDAANILSANLTPITSTVSGSNEEVLNQLTASLSSASNIRDAELTRLIADYCLKRRSFFDSVGLILMHSAWVNDSAIRKNTLATLTDYGKLDPKDRRDKESQLRELLLQTDIVKNEIENN